jgi:hypothetical protein
MLKHVERLRQLFPDLTFTAGQQFCWSPETREIFYKRNDSGQRPLWSLLHETGHALLNHTSYKADFELLRMENEAWERAKLLAEQLEVEIDEDHIQDCLDTYRDWLYKRSICPSCNTKCLQQGDFVHYRCFNCHTSWKVSNNRFGRAYRRHKDISQPALGTKLI